MTVQHPSSRSCPWQPPEQYGAPRKPCSTWMGGHYWTHVSRVEQSLALVTLLSAKIQDHYPPGNENYRPEDGLYRIHTFLCTYLKCANNRVKCTVSQGGHLGTQKKTHHIVFSCVITYTRPSGNENLHLFSWQSDFCSRVQIDHPWT